MQALWCYCLQRCWLHRVRSRGQRVGPSVLRQTRLQPAQQALLTAAAAALSPFVCAADIDGLDSWQALQQLLGNHGPQLNYLNVAALAAKAGALAAQVCGG